MKNIKHGRLIWGSTALTGATISTLEHQERIDLILQIIVTIAHLLIGIF